MNHSGKLSVHMTKSEITSGLVYLFLYIAVIPQVLFILFRLAGGQGGDAQVNLVFNVINAVMCLVLFHKYIMGNVNTLFNPFWGSVQAILLGLAMNCAFGWLARHAASYFFPALENLNDKLIVDLASENRPFVLLSTIVLAPIAEECLFRGVIFQNIFHKSPLSGYIVSVVLFAFLHVCTFIGEYSRLELLMTMLTYVPSGVALAWAYERADSILAPMIMHCLINAYGMAVILKIPFFTFI